MFSTRLIALALFIALPAIADLTPLPGQPAGLPWPTETWATGPLPDDLDHASFEARVDELFESIGRGGVPDTRALLVVQGGRLVYERYAEGFDRNSRFQSWSMAKSVTNALSAVMVREGMIELDASVGVAQWQGADDARSKITVRHLLQMRSGLDNADGFGDEAADPAQMFIARLLFGEGSRVPADYAANVPLVHPVGEFWAYSTGSTAILARRCGELIGGGPVETRDFLRREIFDKLGMRSAQPEFAASGEFLGGGFVHATARDWARLGYLYLRDGVWDGERILPEGWVDFSRTPSPADNNEVYGAHFWLNRDATEGRQWSPLPGGPSSIFMAEGAEFQVVAIDPARDLIAVRLGLDQGTPFPQVKEPFGPLIGAFPERSQP